MLPFSAGAHAGLSYLLMGSRARSTIPAPTPTPTQQDPSEDRTALSGAGRALTKITVFGHIHMSARVGIQV
ncbi:hypothetical protein [Streptomyces antibioticus]|uniref:hypothetical protein n=1 Tax=Streptomyces antibioticus TaxID=1890 RepID=UPI0036DBCD48